MTSKKTAKPTKKSHSSPAESVHSKSDTILVEGPGGRAYVLPGMSPSCDAEAALYKSSGTSHGMKPQQESPTGPTEETRRELSSSLLHEVGNRVTHALVLAAYIELGLEKGEQALAAQTKEAFPELHNCLRELRELVLQMRKES